MYGLASNKLLIGKTFTKYDKLFILIIEAFTKIYECSDIHNKKET